MKPKKIKAVKHPPNSPLRDLANEIAAKLFTVGGTENRADYLQLWRAGTYQCGWRLEPMADTILTLLDQAGVELPPKRKAKR